MTKILASIRPTSLSFIITQTDAVWFLKYPIATCWFVLHYWLCMHANVHVCAWVASTCTREAGHDAAGICVACARPAWEQLHAVREAEQSPCRCDDAEYAWRKPATQWEIRTVERWSGRPCGDSLPKPVCVRIHEKFFLSLLLHSRFKPFSQRVHMLPSRFARGENMLTGVLLQFISLFFFFLLRWCPFLRLSQSAPVKKRPEWSSSCSVVLQKYVKIDAVH